MFVSKNDPKGETMTETTTETAAYLEHMLAALTARMSEDDAEAVAVAYEGGESPEVLGELIAEALTR